MMINIYLSLSVLLLSLLVSVVLLSILMKERYISQYEFLQLNQESQRSRDTISYKHNHKNIFKATANMKTKIFTSTQLIVANICTQIPDCVRRQHSTAEDNETYQDLHHRFEGLNSLLVVCWACCPVCCSILGLILLRGQFFM